MREPGIAVVGAGNWGRNLIRVHAELGSLRSVCDVDEAALSRVRASHPHAKVTRVLDDVLRDPGVRGVVLALPPALHFDFARRALDAGKDVCVEKPLALEASHARILERTAFERARVLMVGHVVRYHPAFVALTSLIESGRYGRILRIEATRRDSREFDGASALWDLAPHDLSMILRLASQAPAQVSITGPGREGDGPAEIRLSFASGLAARVRVSRVHPRRERTFAATLEKGRLVFDDTEPWERKLAVYRSPARAESASVDGEVVEYVTLVPQEPLVAECLHFLECMETRRLPMTDGLDGCGVIEVLENAGTSPAHGSARPDSDGALRGRPPAGLSPRGYAGEVREPALCTLERPARSPRGPLFD